MRCAIKALELTEGEADENPVTCSAYNLHDRVVGGHSRPICLPFDVIRAVISGKM